MNALAFNLLSACTCDTCSIATLVGLIAAAGVTSNGLAATIIVQGEIVPAAEVSEQPDFALALTNDEYYLTISNVDGTADATMTWFGVKSPGYMLERYIESGSDVDNTVLAPNQLDDGNRSEYFLAEAYLPELSSLRYILDSRYPDGSAADLFRFLQNAEVRAGFGPLTGTPQNIDEATAMTDGPVMRAFYSDEVELNDAWILRNADSRSNLPEPSTLGLAGAAVAAGIAVRRRVKVALYAQR